MEVNSKLVKIINFYVYIDTSYNLWYD